MSAYVCLCWNNCLSRTSQTLFCPFLVINRFNSFNPHPPLPDSTNPFVINTTTISIQHSSFHTPNREEMEQYNELLDQFGGDEEALADAIEQFMTEYEKGMFIAMPSCLTRNDSNWQIEEGKYEPHLIIIIRGNRHTRETNNHQQFVPHYSSSFPTQPTIPQTPNNQWTHHDHALDGWNPPHLNTYQ